MTEKIINPYTDVPFADLPIDPPGTRFGSQSLDDVSEMQIGSKQNVFRADPSGIWLGRSTFTQARAETFSVDMDGNLVASSILRRDFQWFSMFESLDGYQNNSNVGGSIAVSRDGVTISSGTTLYDKGWVTKGLSGGPNTTFLWTKNRKFKCQVSFLDTASNQNALICTGSADVDTYNHFGFYLSGSTLRGQNADGTNVTTTSGFVTITAGRRYTLEAIFIAGSHIEYYVDGVSIGTVTVRLPQGSDFPYVIFEAWIQNVNATEKRMVINYFDFWQAN